MDELRGFGEWTSNPLWFKRQAVRIRLLCDFSFFFFHPLRKKKVRVLTLLQSDFKASFFSPAEESSFHCSVSRPDALPRYAVPTYSIAFAKNTLATTALNKDAYQQSDTATVIKLDSFYGNAHMKCYSPRRPARSPFWYNLLYFSTKYSAKYYVMGKRRTPLLNRPGFSSNVPKTHNRNYFPKITQRKKTM